MVVVGDNKSRFLYNISDIKEIKEIGLFETPYDNVNIKTFGERVFFLYNFRDSAEAVYRTHKNIDNNQRKSSPDRICSRNP